MEITPEMIEALAKLREAVADSPEWLADAINVLDNAEIFSAIDDATDYNINEDHVSSQTNYEVPLASQFRCQLSHQGDRCRKELGHSGNHVWDRPENRANDPRLADRPENHKPKSQGWTPKTRMWRQ